MNIRVNTRLCTRVNFGEVCPVCCPALTRVTPPLCRQLQQTRQRLRQALDARLCGRHVHSQVLTVPLSGDAAGLSAVRGCLGQLTLGQAYMGEKVPVRWLRLEEEVARRVRAGLVVATWPEVMRRPAGRSRDSGRQKRKQQTAPLRLGLGIETNPEARFILGERMRLE